MILLVHSTTLTTLQLTTVVTCHMYMYVCHMSICYMYVCTVTVQK